MAKKTRGRQAGGRKARYAAKHLLPRLALWAGVGVFVCGGMMTCDNTTEPEDSESGIVLSNVYKEDGFCILSPKDGSTIFRFSTGGPPLNNSLGVFEKYGEIVLEDRVSVRAFNSRGEKKWETSYGEGQTFTYLWVEKYGDHFWWWGPEHRGNDLYRFKRGAGVPLIEMDCPLLPTAGAIHPKNGALWLVSENEEKLVTISTAGKVIRDIELANRPYDLKIDSEGNVWIAFQERLAKYDADFGELFRVGFSDPLSTKRIVIDGSDNSCWAVAGNSLEKYSSNGKQLIYKSGIGCGAGSKDPGVVYERDQSFWLLNHDANTLRKISKNGEVLFNINTDGSLIDAFGAE